MTETILTRGIVASRVETIAGNARQRRIDHEALHGEEDKLWRDVLSAIAEGRCFDPKGCAEEALKTQDIEFERWCG